MSEKSLSPWLRFYAVLAFAYIYLPIVILMIFSFNSQKLNIRWEGFTLHWYSVLFHDKDVLLATQNTLIIALISTLFATVIGTMAALALQRYRFPGYVFAESIFICSGDHSRSGYGDCPADFLCHAWLQVGTGLRLLWPISHSAFPL